MAAVGRDRRHSRRDGTNCLFGPARQLSQPLRDPLAPRQRSVPGLHRMVDRRRALGLTFRLNSGPLTSLSDVCCRGTSLMVVAGHPSWSSWPIVEGLVSAGGVEVELA